MYVHKIQAGIYKDTRMILKLVEKVTGGSESIIHKSTAERQSLGCSPHIGVTTVHLLAWPSTSAWEQLREPVACMPEMNGCEATGERKVRWKELVRSAAHSSQMSPSQQWNVWTGHEFRRTSHNAWQVKTTTRQLMAILSWQLIKRHGFCMNVVMWGCFLQGTTVCVPPVQMCDRGNTGVVETGDDEFKKKKKKGKKGVLH